MKANPPPVPGPSLDNPNPATHVNEPNPNHHRSDADPNVNRETEFFKRDHVPTAPTTEKEVLAREAAAGHTPNVQRLDYSDPPDGVIPRPVMTATPATPHLGPGGRETETRNGVRYIKGTDIVVGGPTQQ